MAAWFRVQEATGHVVGICRMSEDRARANLRPGEVLVEGSSDVDPRRHKLVAGEWIGREPEPGRESDYAFMRSSGYDIGAQVGALMKVVAALMDEPSIRARVPAETRAEFAALVAKIAALKAQHPKS